MELWIWVASDEADGRLHAGEWARRYDERWRVGDAEAIAVMYAEDAVYRSHAFRPPHRGRAGVLEYTRGAYATEASVEPRFYAPIAEGSRAAVEYWATMREDGADATLAGCTLLRFRPDGLVAEHRDYWHMEPGRREPPAGWGV